jgi:hypothetical protein
MTPFLLFLRPDTNNCLSKAPSSLSSTTPSQANTSKHGTSPPASHSPENSHTDKSRANARVPPSRKAQRRYAPVAIANNEHEHAQFLTQPQPQREGLDTKFKCVFCNSEDSISTKIDKKAGVASLSCKNCVQSYQMSANCTL